MAFREDAWVSCRVVGSDTAHPLPCGAAAAADPQPRVGALWTFGLPQVIRDLDW